jgi:hypothetical protein
MRDKWSGSTPAGGEVCRESLQRAPQARFSCKGCGGSHDLALNSSATSVCPSQQARHLPEWNTDLLEVLIGEMTENGDVNLVLGKALSVCTASNSSSSTIETGEVVPREDIARGYEIGKGQYLRNRHSAALSGFRSSG